MDGVSGWQFADIVNKGTYWMGSSGARSEVAVYCNFMMSKWRAAAWPFTGNGGGEKTGRTVECN